MKCTLLISAAACTAAGFIVPGQNYMKPFIDSVPPTASERVPDNGDAENNIVSFTSFTEEISDNVELSSISALHHPQLQHQAGPEDDTQSYVDGLDYENWGLGNPSLFGHHGHCEHPDKTTYQLMSSKKETSLFANIISQFEDIVDLLNSTEKNHTVLAPRTQSLEKVVNCHPPKEYVKKFVQYHILEEPKTLSGIFHTRTIPTLLEQDELGDHAQRISTQFGVTGLTINYISRIVKPNLCAKNGFVQVLDHFLLPPFQSSDTLSFIPSVFSSFDFGLMKTGLYKRINDTCNHTGGTFFAPTNMAFRKLGPRVNAFLFSRWGEKYLTALLEYHIAFNHTLYSDAYHHPKKDEDDSKTIHVDLPTLLEHHRLSVDIAGFNRFATMKINGFVTVASSDVITRDGVIHVLNDVLIPPKHPRHSGNPHIPRSEVDDSPVPTVEDIIERLNPYIKDH
ncbi:predicted protein [Uncinocarpus reesii 1704]|uniref:FAS1 domain-containing protein n=1 Tax=Uncinocarpus reesii (strain UAMH 1704) TaxID=336963 RepID=C4JPB3_UNCRE|nr:uncharacterized protein UREG_04495 [Uncinocarpus reesii 1704]EEP79649.1 predicted protein [Uncinocarpus reesii 1704]